MKLRLPLSLFAALTALFVSVSASVYAGEVPEGYTSYYLADPDELYDFRSNSQKVAFLLDGSVTFSSSTATWWNSSNLLKKSGSILFTIEEDGDPYSLTFKDAQSNAFKVTSLCVEDIGRLTFSNVVDAADDDSSSSRAYQGGSVNAATVRLLRNKGVSFTNNQAGTSSAYSCPVYSYGGAVYSSSVVEINDNQGSVSLAGNRAVASSSYYYDESYSSFSFGGAIYGDASSSISLSGNTGGVTISGNYASSYSSSYNSYSRGGAIYGGASSSISLSGNTGGVTISGNYASSSSSSSYNSYSYGGAIYGGASSSISLSGNTGGVTISGNYASSSSSSKSYSYGGAIYSEGSIAIQNNDQVLFSGNYEKSYSTYRLRSIYLNSSCSDGGAFHLSAAAGNTITFEDSVYVATSTSGQTVDVVFNGSYTDASGATVTQAGDIIFDAADVASTLKSIKGSRASESEIQNSKTSYLGGQIKLQAGRLIVRNGAQLDGLGIATTARSGAALVLENAGLNHGGASINLRRGTALELGGQNTVVASTMSFSSGSTLKMALNGENRENAVLSLDANLEHFSITLALDGADMLASGRYKLLELADASQYASEDSWNADDITVTATGDAAGLGFENLVWENGVLYVEQGKSIWSNGSGDGVWNASSANWKRNGLAVGYRDGMDVKFDDSAAGTVQLEGAVSPLSVEVDNSIGNDYTFTGSGSLSGGSSLVKNGSGALNLATANEYTGGTRLNGGTLNVQHSQAMGAAESTVVTAAGTQLNVTNNAAVVLAAAEGNDLAGQVSVSAGASLEVQGTGYHAESTQLAGELIFSGAGVNHTGEGAGSLSGNGHLKVQGAGSAVSFSSAADYAGSVSLGGGAAFSADVLEMKEGAVLSALASGSSLGLSDVLLPGAAQVEMHTTRFESYSGTLNADVAANAYTAGSIDTASGLVLQGGATYQATGSSLDLGGNTLTLNAGEGNPFVSLMLELDGRYMPVDTQIVLFTGVSSLVINAVEFSGADTAHVFAASDYLKGDYVFESTALVYDGNVGCVYLVEAMPEPTTTTLSLLALAGLAARRRRR
ncbi:MAG: autotransporter-associated beta strand repeat-containing protein [Akkermansia sp.]|nr:autotransporter-associated beta strand repeat-containing protein [Akkermansia sp.]